MLIERTARMLASREAATLRSVVADADLSTMAVYTHFGGMPGLLGAVRQEGFNRLDAHLAASDPTADPVSDLAAAAAAYAAVAREYPDLYRLMFDGSLPLPDPDAADSTLRHVIDAVGRAVSAGRFRIDVDPIELANELWMMGHGACTLVVNGVLSYEQVEPVILSGLEHLYAAAGDNAYDARRSITNGWARIAASGVPLTDTAHHEWWRS